MPFYDFSIAYLLAPVSRESPSGFARSPHPNTCKRFWSLVHITNDLIIQEIYGYLHAACITSIYIYHNPVMARDQRMETGHPRRNVDFSIPSPGGEGRFVIRQLTWPTNVGRPMP